MSESLSIGDHHAPVPFEWSIAPCRGGPSRGRQLAPDALQVATEADMNGYGYQLPGEGKVDEAIEVFRKNAKDYPRSWNTYDSLGEAYTLKGDKRQAIANYSRALALTKDPDNKKRIEGVLAGLR